MSKSVLLLSLLWSLVEVHSQTFPYVSFNGTTLANHSYVDLSQVGRPDVYSGEGVLCITDLTTCCTSSYGAHRGDWYFPDGTILPFTATHVDTSVLLHYTRAVKYFVHVLRVQWIPLNIIPFNRISRL